MSCLWNGNERDWKGSAAQPGDDPGAGEDPGGLVLHLRLPAVLSGSYTSAEAIVHIMTQKFVMGSPLYQQEQEWNRQGDKTLQVDHVQMDSAGSGGVAGAGV